MGLRKQVELGADSSSRQWRVPNQRTIKPGETGDAPKMGRPGDLSRAADGKSSPGPEPLPGGIGSAPDGGAGRAPTRWPDRPSGARHGFRDRSEEHTSELQSLMRISYAVFCLKK